MHKGFKKSFNGFIVAATIFSFGATPAFAAEDHFPKQSEPVTAIAPQAFSTVASTAETPDLGHLLDLASTEFAPAASFDVDAAIAVARSELGTSRPTGWSMPGECIMSAKRWVNSAGGSWNSAGTPVSNYAAATAIPYHLVEPGDIIQYENIFAPHAWATGVHTMMVTGVNEDGTLDIIQSNVPYGSGLVTEEKNWLPDPPDGFTTSIWRF